MKKLFCNNMCTQYSVNLTGRFGEVRLEPNHRPSPLYGSELTKASVSYILNNVVLYMGWHNSFALSYR